DPTIAALQVAWGFLPRPCTPRLPDPSADWHAIELLDDDRVRLRRAAWLDLGGIAKGWAVDRAVEILIAHGAHDICGHAGGDMRVAGPRAQTVHLRRGDRGIDALPLVELADAALATSFSAAQRGSRGRRRGLHIDGRARSAVAATTCVSVVAASCAVA